MTCSSFKHHSDSAYLSEKTTTAIGVFLIPSSIDSQHSSPIRIDLRSRYGCNPCFLRASYKNPTNPVFVSGPLWLRKTSYLSKLSAHQQGDWLIQVTAMSNFPNCKKLLSKPLLWTRNEQILYKKLNSKQVKVLRFKLDLTFPCGFHRDR